VKATTSDIKGAGVMTFGSAIFVDDTIRMILRKVDAEFIKANGVERQIWRYFSDCASDGM
jgi:hypothetical protein